jgi:hypothetical protein
LHHEIAWNIVQRILIDAPSVDYDNENGSGDKTIEITNDNANAMLEKINQMKR